MPKLYVYLDEQAGAERQESFMQIMQRLLPFVHSAESTDSLGSLAPHLSISSLSDLQKVESEQLLGVIEQSTSIIKSAADITCNSSCASVSANTPHDLSLQNKADTLVQSRFSASCKAYLEKDRSCASDFILNDSLPVQGSLQPQEQGSNNYQIQEQIQNNYQSQDQSPNNKYYSTAALALASGLMWDASVQIKKWQIVFLNEPAYLHLLSLMKNAARFLSKYGQEALQKSEYACLSGEDLLIAFTQEGAGLSMLKAGKMLPLRLDFEVLSYRQRLLRGGRQKEAVSRAVLQGIADSAVVFDATAGLGRESMILAHAGARVLAFERQLPIWIILADALHRAQRSRFFPFVLPELYALGTIKDYVVQDGNNNMLEQRPLYSEKADSWGRPEVIYYDPMFPERESTAQVKKDMFIFQQVIGHDTDTEEFLRYAMTLATKRVVVKRPSFAPAVETAEIKRAYAVDGGQCRFDCYTV